MIMITIDGISCGAEAGETVLQVARKQGIRIPTLCYHPALRPSGSCKVCVVAVSGKTGDKEIAMLSCVLKASEGMTVQTTGPTVTAARTRAFKNLLQMAPESRRLRELAAEYGIDLGPPPDGCIRCRLCVRVCKDVVKADALRMEKRNNINVVTFDPDHCIGCGTCANICPTHVIRVSDQDNLRTLTLRDEIVGRYPLERCQGCGRGFATTRFIYHIEHRQVDHRTPPHPHAKEEHHYCPTCIKLFSDKTRPIAGRTGTQPLAGR